jgi:geranylgeranylglycerol-phosphate geranylgeranyltransferase
MIKKLKGFLQLVRPELPFSAGICVVMGQLLALSEFAPVEIAVTGFLSVFLVSASILVLNDYFDVETDRINAPLRPIPSGVVSQSGALYFTWALLAGGLMLSFYISNAALIISAGLFVIGFLYNRRFKKNGLAGNIMVSFSVGMTFIFGGLSVDQPFNKVVLFFAVIAALINLGEEIAADSLDVKGDLLIGSRSLAIIYGRPAAVKTSVFIFFIVIILSLIPFALEWFPLIYLVPIAVMDISVGYSALKLLRSGEEEGRLHIRRIYLGATLGILLFLVMSLAGV